MSIAIITGSSGLVGAESVRVFDALGLDVVGIDNDMRRVYFGPDASTRRAAELLQRSLPRYRSETVDVRDAGAIDRIFSRHGKSTALIIHAAGQPSHDWAARDPRTDFEVNAGGTLHLLEAARRHCPDAVFIQLSTNKVYGDTPNQLPLVEREARWELPDEHPFYARGIDESLTIDQCLHSLFGVSKASADLLAQEYGRYFGMRTAVFRCGCITGPGHAGAELHGFLAYLVQCAVTGGTYRILGYKGKQVRDNIHAADLASAFVHAFQQPRSGEVYNMGGGRANSCSLLEAIQLCDTATRRPLKTTYVDTPRTGDHQWWITDTRKFQSHHPGWNLTRRLPQIIEDMVSRMCLD